MKKERIRRKEIIKNMISGDLGRQPYYLLYTKWKENLMQGNYPIKSILIFYGIQTVCESRRSHGSLSVK